MGVEVQGGGGLAGCRKEVWEEVASGWDLQEEQSSLLLTCVFSPLSTFAGSVLAAAESFMQAF